MKRLKTHWKQCSQEESLDLLPFQLEPALLFLPSRHSLNVDWNWGQRAAMLLEYVRIYFELSTIDASTAVLRQKVTSNGSVGSSFCIIGENDIFFLQRHLNFTASKSTMQCEVVPAKEWQLHRVRRIERIVEVHFQAFKILIAYREFVFNRWLVAFKLLCSGARPERGLTGGKLPRETSSTVGFVQFNDNATADSCPGR